MHPSTTDPPSAPLFGIYVHYPRCRNACGYCDFPKLRRERFADGDYADAVIRELQARAGAYAGRTLEALYFGGGTPSLWPAPELARVIAAAREGFAAAAALEVSLEANPETVDARVADALCRAGVTRLSIGVQSLDDGALRGLTRTHDARCAAQAVRTARAAGFSAVSCDLMFGLAGQDVAHHLDQLRALLALGPDHVSSYGLTLSQRAPLRLAGYPLPDDDLLAEMMERGRELLENEGLLQYEVSNFAAPAMRCRHHALVWSGAPYLGLGAWAHSLVPGRDARQPWIRVANPAHGAYAAAMAGGALGGDPPVVGGAEVIRCSPAQIRDDALMLGLRTVDGIDRQRFRRALGADPLAGREQPAAELVAAELLHVDERRIRPTRRGIWFADELALRLCAGGLRAADDAPGVGSA